MITLIAFLHLSFREELVFHGYPLRRFKTWFGLWGVQLIVASVFALEHRAPGNLDLVENPGAGKRPVYSANALQHWKRDIALGMFSAASRRAL